jgi:uncharacterized radical SAM superfamily Fe-S cluster-containing enzyme
VEAPHPIFDANDAVASEAAKDHDECLPHCLEKDPARVLVREGQVFLHKSCPVHGSDEALMASDPRLYWNAGADGGCGSGCMFNHSCTLIFEITERCNLSGCPSVGFPPFRQRHPGLRGPVRKTTGLFARQPGYRRRSSPTK